MGSQTNNITDEIPFEIPSNWFWCRLKHIGEIVGGGTPSTAVKEYWFNGSIVWITPKNMSKLKTNYIIDSDRKITLKGLQNSSTKLMPPDSIIMSSRAPIGYIAINKVPACTSQGCKSVVPYLSNMSEFLLYIIKSSINRIISASSGTTFDEISGTEFSNILIPLAPINEQIRIVKQIDETLKLLRNISEEYKSIQELVTVTKSKILDSFFSENSSYKSYYPITKGILSNFCDKITKGTTPTSYGFKYQSSGIPFVKVENVDNFKINLNTINCYISEETHEFQKRSQLKEDDILFSIAGTIGKLCLVRKENTPANTNQAFAIISGYNKYIAPKYLLYYLEWTKHSNSKVDSHGLGMNNATLTGLKNLEIWFPQEISNQQKIVYEIENILSKLKQIIS